MRTNDPLASSESRGSIAHAADFLRRYPGETVFFYTRVEIPPDLARFRIRIVLPPGLLLVDTRASGMLSGHAPLMAQEDGTVHILWDVDRLAGELEKIEISTETRVDATSVDRTCESRAILSGDNDSGCEEAVSVGVKAKGSYLKYLPNIYQEDEFMGRFLMLFESFLGPVEKQIEGLPNYFDPQVAPAELLPWLASWSGLVLDDLLPDDRRRELLKAAAFLFKKRGTRQGLEKYLQITTGGSVTITEHFSENFRLGSTAFLGPGIALGEENLPNTFSVRLKLPPFPADLSAEECQQRSRLIEQKVVAILESEKPVHTGYDLHFEIT